MLYALCNIIATYAYFEILCYEINQKKKSNIKLVLSIWSKSIDCCQF